MEGWLPKVGQTSVRLPWRAARQLAAARIAQTQGLPPVPLRVLAAVQAATLPQLPLGASRPSPWVDRLACRRRPGGLREVTED